MHPGTGCAHVMTSQIFRPRHRNRRPRFKIPEPKSDFQISCERRLTDLNIPYFVFKNKQKTQDIWSNFSIFIAFRYILTI